MNIFAKSVALITTFVVATFALTVNSTHAYVQGGPAALKVSPTSSSATTGQNFTIKVMFTTGGQAITGVAARLTYNVPASNDLEVVSVTPNSALGWSFPVQSSSISGGKMNIDIMGLTSSTTGYTGSGDVELATITLRATSAFSNKALSFDQSQSQILKKSDASDILGSLGTATITAAGGSVAATTPSPTPTPTPAVATPTPTPTTSSSTTTDTTGTDTTNQIAESAGVGGGGAEVPQTQSLPVSGTASVTLAVALAGLALVGGAVFFKLRQ